MKFKRQGTRVLKDGRTILSGTDYTRHKFKVWEQQEQRCASCGHYLPFTEAVFDHAKGRGLGGGKRDDLDPDNKIRHSWCHAVKHYRERDLAAVGAH